VATLAEPLGPEQIAWPAIERIALLGFHRQIEHVPIAPRPWRLRSRTCGPSSLAGFGRRDQSTCQRVLIMTIQARSSPTLRRDRTSVT
jgi:hypothetical protein